LSLFLFPLSFFSLFFWSFAIPSSCFLLSYTGYPKTFFSANQIGSKSKKDRSPPQKERRLEGSRKAEGKDLEDQKRLLKKGKKKEKLFFAQRKSLLGGCSPCFALQPLQDSHPSLQKKSWSDKYGKEKGRGEVSAL
jgi:hypothetical protein